jgi:hypothetical protein
MLYDWLYTWIVDQDLKVQWRRKIYNQISGEFVDYECQIMCNCKKCRAPGNHGREKKLQSPPPPKHTKMK